MGAAPLKKKQLSQDEPAVSPPPRPPVPAATAHEPLSAPPAPATHKPDPAIDPGQWDQIIEGIRNELGNGTASLLSGAFPAKMSGGVLTLEFPAAAALQKQMCESNGRSQQIAKVVSGHLGGEVAIELTLAQGGQDKGSTARPGRGLNAKRRKELLSDPAVRTVLAELDATITDIEERTEQ